MCVCIHTHRRTDTIENNTPLSRFADVHNSTANANYSVRVTDCRAGPIAVGLLYGLPASLIQRLQSVLNAAAWLISGSHVQNISPTRSSAYSSCVFLSASLTNYCSHSGTPSHQWYCVSVYSLLAVLFHSSRGCDASRQWLAAVLYFPSSGSRPTVSSFLYGQQASFFSQFPDQHRRDGVLEDCPRPRVQLKDKFFWPWHGLEVVWPWPWPRPRMPGLEGSFPWS